MSSGSPTASRSSVVSRSKLVVRRLPPTLPEELFWKSVSTWVTDETCSWKRYVKGKDGNGQDGHLIHSRAYCLMSSPEALVNFHRGFDGHVFRSKTGGEHQAVVEYSPLQKTPYKAKVKVDARQGTIDDDPDYLSFLESLNAAPTKPVIEVSVPAPQPLITPLIEHLRAAKTSKSQAKSASKLAQSSSAEDARRSAALAAVNKAAARRGPPAQGGPTMVAGKGREVMITPTSSTDMAGNAGGEGKKKKGKRERGGSPARGVSPVRGSQASVGPHGSSTLAPAASIASNGMRAPSPALVGGESRGGGRGRGGRGGRGRGIGDGGGGGGGRGRGRGGPERTAHEAVLQILTTNSYAERGRGRGGGRGGGSGGRGGAVSDAGTSEARIDM